jgi:hypothetical protein
MLRVGSHARAYNAPQPGAKPPTRFIRENDPIVFVGNGRSLDESARIVKARAVKGWNILKNHFLYNDLPWYFGKLPGDVPKPTVADRVELLMERARFSPELRRNKPHFKIPAGKGTYLRLLSCTTVPGVTDPYWKCNSSGRLISQGKNTNVGLRSKVPITRNYYWDYDIKHPKKAGYGLWFAGDRSKCVRCYLYDRRLGFDKFMGRQIRLCGSANKPFKVETVHITHKGKKTRQRCQVGIRTRQ